MASTPRPPDRVHVERLLDCLVALAYEDYGRVAMLVETPRSGVHLVRDAVEAIPGRGLAGDHDRKSFYKGRLMPGREVTAIAREVLDVLGVDPVVVGDNLITEGIDLGALEPGDLVEAGDVLLERSAPDHRPCTVFRDRTSPEAFAAVSRGYRGALFTIRHGGTLRVGMPLRVRRAP